MNPLISVVVPIYNVEKYLKKCLDSILSQSYTNLEIILVDDGSPDNCGKICEEYRNKDSRIIVIHKKMEVFHPQEMRELTFVKANTYLLLIVMILFHPLILRTCILL